MTSASKYESLKLAAPEYTNIGGIANPMAKLSPGLEQYVGRMQVVVRLNTPSVGQLGASDAGSRMSHKVNIDSEQAALISRLRAAAPDMEVLAQTQVVLNAVFVELDAAALPDIAADFAVSRIAPVGHYELDLSETVPYIGASAVQDLGFDGDGIRVAVLDSGVDYTHADLGGSGDPADYVANDGTIIEPGTFPTAKVVDGFDFLGNQWPNGPVLPDPDPLDDLALTPGAFAGHGTHVADIIAGQNGVAPGASIVAVKVCASLASSCNGVALINGMEFSVDPNGDGDPSDGVDIINMSLGANYGQAFDDDLSAAVDAATAVGVLTVSSAGNCGDLPYCTGTPSSAPTALAVAQTQVPSAVGFSMNVVQPAADAGLYDAVKYPWTPDPAALLQAEVVYGDVDGDNQNGCAPYDGDFTGRIILADRGGCFFSDKVQNAEAAGAIVGIVGLVAPGAPFPGGFGQGDLPTIPGFNISQADADILRNAIAAGDVAEVAFGPEFTESLLGFTVSSTARGPDMSFNAIKPEIGAPGASVSAEVATGTLRGTFGGTSGASPMVAGSAALLLEACLDGQAPPSKGKGKGKRRGGKKRCDPLEIKARLMNTGFRDILSDTTGGLAEITRIGGGEVRADSALSTNFIAYSSDDDQPSIGLGVVDVAEKTTIEREIEVVNLSRRGVLARITPTFRFDDAAASGAVDVDVRSLIGVGRGRSREFDIKFTIDPAALGGNFMTSGVEGNSAANLSAMEFDGYLLLNDVRKGTEVALPWHIVARKVAKVDPASDSLAGGGFPESISLSNDGAGIAQNDAYSIIALSDEMPRGERGQQSPIPDIRAVGVTTIPVPAGVCSGADSFLWVFAINTWDRQTHLVPVSHQIGLDIDRDGTPDFTVLNRDVTFNNVTDGRQLSWVLDESTGAAGAFFFAEHGTNTGNTALTICAEQIGLSAADLGATPVDVTVFAQDFYYGGPGDEIGGITITPLGEQYVGVPSGDIEGNGIGALDVFDFGALPGNSPELGVMLFTNGDRGAGNRGAATEDTEALLLLAPGVDAPTPLDPDDDDDDDSDSDSDDDSDSDSDSDD